MRYLIQELQNLNSVREGLLHEGSLRGAKTRATREQVFHGTVLKISDEYGRPVAYKSPRLGWIHFADD